MVCVAFLAEYAPANDSGVEYTRLPGNFGRAE